MKVKVSTEYTNKIAAAIESGIFREIKKNQYSFEEVEQLCSFYMSLKNSTREQSFAEYELKETIASVISDIIKTDNKQIVNDAENLDYICEIMQLYNALNNRSSNNGAKSKSEDKKEEKFEKKKEFKKDDKKEDSGASSSIKNEKYRPNENFKFKNNEKKDTDKPEKKEDKQKEKEDKKEYNKDVNKESEETEEEKKIEVDYVDNPQFDFDDEQLY